MGKVTTTLLMANYLEKEWHEIIEEKEDVIKNNAKIIASLDIKKLEVQRKTKHKVKESKPKYKCDKCDYLSIF